MSGNPRTPELNPDFAWLNTDRPLTFAKELAGQVVLLDFWTYCCINDEVLLQRTLLGASWPLAFELPAQPAGSADLSVQVSFAYCHEGQGVCVPARTAWSVPVRFEDAGDAAHELTAAVA